MSNIKRKDYIEDRISELETCIINSKCLKNNKPVKNYLAVGDSILVGTGSNEGNYGFCQMTADTSVTQIGGSFFKRMGNILTMDATHWTKCDMYDGFPKRLVYSIDESELGVYTIQHSPSKFIIQYAKRPDGGYCEVYAGDTKLGEVNSLGEVKDGCIAEFDVPINKAVKIKTISGQKFYLNDMFVASTEAVGNRFYDFGVGGSQASDWSVQAFKDRLDVGDIDVLIWEYLANDFGNKNLDTFKSKTEEVITYARNKGIDVILIITLGQQSTEEGEENKALWKHFKDFIYKLSNEKECCLIDYDKYFGGYSSGNSNGILSDSVHPTTKGHIMMANILCNLLFSKNCLAYEGKKVNQTSGNGVLFGAEIDTNPKIMQEVLFENVYKRGGNDFSVFAKTPLQMSILHTGIYPVNVPAGNIAINKNKRLAEFNNGNETTQEWKPIYAYPYLPVVSDNPTEIGRPVLKDNNIVFMNSSYTVKTLATTSDLEPNIVDILPEANATYRGKIIILANSTGDEVYICIKKDDSTYEWKQITL